MWTGRKKIFTFISVFCLFLLIGCAPLSYRTHPEFETRSKNIKSPQLIPPDVKIYKLTAGGVPELIDEWCSTGKENVLKAITESFKDKPTKLQIIPIDKELEEELEDIQALYRAVCTSIYLHTYYGLTSFPEKKKNFDYSIGPIDKILQKYGTDTLVIVYGRDEISTGGRQALQATSVLLGALTGVYMHVRAGITAMSVAVIDPSGSILWFCTKSSEGGHDLRNYESAEGFVKDVFSNFLKSEKESHKTTE